MRRIVALDVLRGFALCGILFANVKPIAHRGAPLGTTDLPASWAETVLHVLVDQRFFPIFALLFGIGFALMARSAPRIVLGRRLLALLAIGLAHFLLLWKGDILSVYATVGLLVLLPSTWLPRRVVAIAAVVLIVPAVTLLGGYYAVVPGLFLLGSALVRYDVVTRLDSAPWTALALFVAAAVPVTILQLHEVAGRITGPVAGLLTAGAYICGLLILLRTRLAGTVTAVFRPLGRMALTNYLTATVLVLAIARMVGDPDSWATGRVVAVATAVLLTQWIWSVLWLRRHQQGPVEWLWRRVTWWHTVRARG